MKSDRIIVRFFLFNSIPLPLMPTRLSVTLIDIYNADLVVLNHFMPIEWSCRMHDAKEDIYRGADADAKHLQNEEK